MHNNKARLREYAITDRSTIKPTNLTLSCSAAFVPRVVSPSIINIDKSIIHAAWKSKTYYCQNGRNRVRYLLIVMDNHR